MLKEPDGSKSEVDTPGPLLSLPPELRHAMMERLSNIQEAIDTKDFSDSALVKKCQIPKSARVSSTKTRQAVIARAPPALVIHVNRSLFDEYTGAQKKNYADVHYPRILDALPWCLGTRIEDEASTECWAMDPTKSLVPGTRTLDDSSAISYQLKAVVTHYGRHENGHYICYRQHTSSQPTPDDATLPVEKTSSAGASENWWRLSDDDVSTVTEHDALNQGGVFMLFYERRKGLEGAADSLCATEADLLDPSVAHSVPAEPVQLHRVAVSESVPVSGQKIKVEDEGSEELSSGQEDRAGGDQAPAETQELDEKISTPSHEVRRPVVMRTSRSRPKGRKSGYLSGPPTVTAT